MVPSHSGRDRQLVVHPAVTGTEVDRPRGGSSSVLFIARTPGELFEVALAEVGQCDGSPPRSRTKRLREPPLGGSEGHRHPLSCGRGTARKSVKGLIARLRHVYLRSDKRMSENKKSEPPDGVVFRVSLARVRRVAKFASEQRAWSALAHQVGVDPYASRTDFLALDPPLLLGSWRW